MPIGKMFCYPPGWVVCVVIFLPRASSEEPQDGYNTASRSASAPVRLSLSDSPQIERAEFILSDATVEYSLHDSPAHQPGGSDYPNVVSLDPGHPAKPLLDRPGDINVGDCLPERYGLDNAVRAGHPNQVAWWARCSFDERYSAWQVGGGTSWILPWKSRHKTRQEGTWGSDYHGLFQPHRVWMDWSCERPQGGLGAYATDRKSAF